MYTTCIHLHICLFNIVTKDLLARFDGLYRTDPERTRFTGALCGLGWDHNSGGAALPENDIEVAFDTAFDAEDISSVSIL